MTSPNPLWRLVIVAVAVLLATGCKPETQTPDPDTAPEAPSQSADPSPAAPASPPPPLERLTLEPSAAGTVEPQPITVAAETTPLEAGTAVARTTTVAMKSNMRRTPTDGGPVQDAPFGSTRSVERTLLAAELGEPVPAKLEISYRKALESRSMLDKEREAQLPVAEKAFVLDSAPGDEKPAITVREGEMDDLARPILEAEYASLLALSRLGQHLPDTELTPGQTLELPPSVLDALVASGSDGGTVEKIHLTYLGTRTVEGDTTVAVFGIDMTLGGDTGDGTSMRATLAGELTVVAKTARIDSLRVSGDLEMHGKAGDRATLDALGQMRIEERFVYR